MNINKVIDVRRHLEQIILGDGLPEFFKRDASITETELIEQAKELSILIKFPINQKYVDKSKEIPENAAIVPFTPFFMNSLLKGTYDSIGKIEDLFKHIFPEKSSKKISKKMFHNGIICPSFYDKISNLIFYPNNFKKNFKEFIDAENLEESKISYDVDSETELMQARFLLKLIEDNKPFLDLTRMLSYELIQSTEYPLDINDFYSNPGDPNKTSQDLMVSRFKFSLLACHLGYFKKPQYGKFETTFSYAAGVPTDELIKKGFDLVKRTQEEIYEDILLQHKAETFLFKHLVHVYSDMIETIEKQDEKIRSDEKYKTQLETSLMDDKNLLESVLAQRELEKSKCEECRKKLEIDLATRVENSSKQIIDENTSLKATVKKTNYTGEKVASLERTVHGQEAEIQKYKKDIAQLNTNVLLLEGKLKNSIPKPDYNVIVEIDRPRKLAFTDEHYSILLRSITQLQQEIKRKIINKSDYGSYEELRLSFPEYDFFFKLETSNYFRVFYTIKETTVIILDVMNHDEYNKTLGHKVKGK